MNRHRDAETENDRSLAPEEARLVAGMREHYAPEPLSPARRSAFDAALRERIERSRRRVSWTPAFGAALAAAALAALLLLRGAGSAPEAERQAGTTDGWASTLLYGDPAAYDDVATVPDESLPPQYAAIASTFLD